MTERAIEDILTTSGDCFASGFRHDNLYRTFTLDTEVSYLICVNYVGDCEGTIFPGEVKTCTVQNYIWLGSIITGPFGNPANDGNKAETTSQQSNNAIPTTSTQSSNVVGPPQPSNTGAILPLQSSSVGAPSTFSSSPSSSTLVNILPSNPN